MGLKTIETGLSPIDVEPKRAPQAEDQEREGVAAKSPDRRVRHGDKYDWGTEGRETYARFAAGHASMDAALQRITEGITDGPSRTLAHNYAKLESHGDLALGGRLGNLPVGIAEMTIRRFIDRIGASEPDSDRRGEGVVATKGDIDILRSVEESEKPGTSPRVVLSARHWNAGSEMPETLTDFDNDGTKHEPHTGRIFAGTPRTNAGIVDK